MNTDAPLISSDTSAAGWSPNHLRRCWPPHRAANADRRRPLLIHAVCKAARLIVLWIERVRQRRSLAALTDRELHDVGLSRYDAVYESRKPFWRP